MLIHTDPTYNQTRYDVTMDKLWYGVFVNVQLENADAEDNVEGFDTSASIGE